MSHPDLTTFRHQWSTQLDLEIDFRFQLLRPAIDLVLVPVVPEETTDGYFHRLFRDYLDTLENEDRITLITGRGPIVEKVEEWRRRGDFAERLHEALADATTRSSYQILKGIETFLGHPVTTPARGLIFLGGTRQMKTENGKKTDTRSTNLVRKLQRTLVKDLHPGEVLFLVETESAGSKEEKDTIDLRIGSNEEPDGRLLARRLHPRLLPHLLRKVRIETGLTGPIRHQFRPASFEEPPVESETGILHGVAVAGVPTKVFATATTARTKETPPPRLFIDDPLHGAERTTGAPAQP